MEIVERGAAGEQHFGDDDLEQTMAIWAVVLDFVLLRNRYVFNDPLEIKEVNTYIISRIHIGVLMQERIKILIIVKVVSTYPSCCCFSEIPTEDANPGIKLKL